MLKKIIILIATFVLIDVLVVCLTKMIKNEQTPLGTSNNNAIVVDASNTPLKFRILPDSTAEVIESDSIRRALINSACPDLIKPSYRDLDSIDIPTNVKINGKTYLVSSIGEYAFFHSYNIKHITLPASITNIGNNAFWGYRFAHIEIPASIKSIGTGAFSYCSLTSIKIPSGVTSIPDHTFLRCTNLKEVILPASIKVIGNEAFDGCDSLKSVTLPASVKDIRDYAFARSGLTSIEIPRSVKDIGDGAFYYCTNFSQY